MTDREMPDALGAVCAGIAIADEIDAFASFATTTRINSPSTWWVIRRGCPIINTHI